MVSSTVSADGCAPDEVTEATSTDRGLLAGLYAINPRDSGTQQRASIASRLATTIKNDAQSEAH